jgi:hypothetical protein
MAREGRRNNVLEISGIPLFSFPSFFSLFLFRPREGGEEGTVDYAR